MVSTPTADYGVLLRFIALNPNDLIVNVKQGKTGTFKTIRDSAYAPTASAGASPD